MAMSARLRAMETAHMGALAQARAEAMRSQLLLEGRLAQLEKGMSTPHGGSSDSHDTTTPQPVVLDVAPRVACGTPGVSAP